MATKKKTPSKPSKKKPCPTCKGSGKQGRGQPTKYKASYCQRLIKHREAGKSFESFAGVIGAHRDTLYEWEKTHDEFSDAIKKGTEKALNQWEAWLIDGMLGPREVDGKKIGPTKFNVAACIFAMKNLFPDMYRDRMEIDGIPGKGLPFDQLPDEVLALIATGGRDLKEFIRALQSKPKKSCTPKKKRKAKK